MKLEERKQISVYDIFLVIGRLFSLMYFDPAWVAQDLFRL